MPFTQYLHPPKNKFLHKFFSRYPSFHFLKFLINQNLHRAFSYCFFKTIYWIWFKILNRIEIQNRKIIRPRQPDFRGEPFLIVENHNVDCDVMMHMATWAHLGYFSFVFTTEGSFDNRHALATSLTNFIEMIPRYASGQASVLRMVRRLQKGDIVNICPAGTYPTGKYANSALVTEGFSGAARVAYNYEKNTGKKLWIQPACSIGGNLAYPPRKYVKNFKRLINYKIIIRFGPPFTLNFSETPDYNEIKAKTHEIDMTIARIWHQKKLIPNLQKEWRRQETGVGKPRNYKIQS